MAVQLCLVFEKIDEIKNELKGLNDDLKTQIEDDEELVDLNNKLSEIRLKANAIKSRIKADNSSLLDKIEEAKRNLQSEKQMLTDKALLDLVNGNDINIKRNGFLYEPVFSVKYKKASPLDEDENFFAK